MVIFNLQYMIQNQYFIMPWVNVNDHVTLLPEIKPLLEKISKLSDHFKKFLILRLENPNGTAVLV